jgi:hypothetical protein
MQPLSSLKRKMSKKRNRHSMQGLDDFTRRNGDKMTSTPSLTEPNEVNFFTRFYVRTWEGEKINLVCWAGVSMWMPHRRQFSWLNR